MKHICCICGKQFDGYGNNPWPIKSVYGSEVCCNDCNYSIVIPARVKAVINHHNIKEEN